MVACRKVNIKYTSSGTELTAFIPDLCQVQAVLRIVMATELGAILFTLIHSGPSTFDWNFLALTSLFMLWIALTSAGILCRWRETLARRPTASQARLAFIVVLSVTLVYTLLAECVRLQVWSQKDLHWVSDLQPGFLVYCLAIAAILGGVGLRYLYLQHLSSQQQQAGLEARVQALQARIRPHFLFNSMNSIAGLIPLDPHQAEEAVIDLAELFRNALRDSREQVTLHQELEVCQRYLRIEKLRLGDRLAIDWHITPGMDTLRVPPLCIQPLVENAIYHGIQPRPEGGTLRLRVYRQKDAFYIEVTNPLPDSKPQRLVPSEPESGHQGNRVALDNIRSRLQAFYGDQAVLKTSRQDDKFTAIIRIPLGGADT